MEFLLSTNKKILLNYLYDNISFIGFNKLKTRLNETKSLLDNIPSDIYKILVTQQDVYRSLKLIIKNRFNMQVVTNATLKMYEMIIAFNLIDPHDTKPLNVFCNAELPGGFIIAINHYIKTKTIRNLNWVANSYIHNNLLQDTYGFYKHNKSNWLMDDANNGDITNINNILYMKAKILERFKDGIDLYTSDVGIDNSSDYNSQEEQTLLLNYCQILCGLLVLKLDGTMVTKQFTYFTSFNISILLLLCYLFKNVYIAKPLTSRPINSEIYIVCKGFNKMTEEIEMFLLTFLEKKINPKIPLLIYSRIPVKLIHIANNIYNNQIEHIIKIYKLYEMYKDDIEALNKLKYNYGLYHSKWINKMRLERIDSTEFIPYQIEK